MQQPPSSPVEDAADRVGERRGRNPIESARAAIRRRDLPNGTPVRIWGGAGVGARCSVCGARIERDDVEFEAEFDVDGAARQHHFHVPCFTAWESELERSETLDPAAPFDAAPVVASPRRTEADS